MIARLKGLANFGGAGRSAELVRPAIVLGAVAVVSLSVALFGGGESSAASDAPGDAAVAESADAHGDEPATDEQGDEPATDEHGDEPATDEHGEEPATDEHGDEPAADEHGDEPAVDAFGEEPADEHGDEPAADEYGDEPAADEHADPPPATATPKPTFTLGVTATPSPGDVRWTDFISGEFGISFRYEVRPDGFVLEQERTPEGDPVVTWLLTRASELDSDSGAAPRGIAVQVYVPDPLPADAEAWVRGSADSHFGAENGLLLPAMVGGAQGVRYRWSGPDEAVSTVVSFDGRIWVFTSTSREVSVGAFDVLLDSVVFWQ